MKSNSSLDARIGALETVAVIQILSRAAAHEKPGDEVNRVFALAYEIALNRLEASQVGPEQEAAAKVFTAIDRLYELLERFVEGNSDELE